MIEDYQRYYYLENRRKELKGKLSVFLNNFNVSNLIKIYDQNDNVIFEGRIGEVHKDYEYGIRNKRNCHI